MKESFQVLDHLFVFSCGINRLTCLGNEESLVCGTNFGETPGERIPELIFFEE